MLTLILYYLVIPFLLSGAVLKLIKKYGKVAPDPALASLYSKEPLAKKWFRAARRDSHGTSLLGDSETHGEAVDRIYAARGRAQVLGEKAAFVVLNDKAEILEEVNS